MASENDRWDLLCYVHFFASICLVTRLHNTLIDWDWKLFASGLSGQNHNASRMYNSQGCFLWNCPYWCIKFYVDGIIVSCKYQANSSAKTVLAWCRNKDSWSTMPQQLCKHQFMSFYGVSSIMTAHLHWLPGSEWPRWSPKVWVKWHLTPKHSYHSSQEFILFALKTLHHLLICILYLCLWE